MRILRQKHRCCPVYQLLTPASPSLVLEVQGFGLLHIGFDAVIWNPKGADQVHKSLNDAREGAALALRHVMRASAHIGDG